AAPSCSRRSATKSRRAVTGPSSRRLEILAEQFFVERLGVLVLPARIKETVAERVKGLLAGAVAARQPRRAGKVRELAFVFEPAEDGADLTHNQLEHGYLLVEKVEELLLDRAPRDQVEDEHLAALTDAVDAADPLLDRHRVPRHVEIDQRVAEL